MPWMLRHRQLSLPERWRHLAVAGATCLLVLAPWTIRNVRTFEEFVPLSTNGNELIMYANCDEAYNGRLIGFWSFDCQEQLPGRVRRSGGRRVAEGRVLAGGGCRLRP